MECRMGCVACCIAPSINVLNKTAGERCQYLTDDLLCAVFNTDKRPAACGEFMPEPSVCGSCRQEAMQLITELEQLTAP